MPRVYHDPVCCSRLFGFLKLGMFENGPGLRASRSHRGFVCEGSFTGLDLVPKL